jgi:hypothetical protein
VLGVKISHSPICMLIAPRMMIPRYGLSLLHDVRVETEVKASSRKLTFCGLVDETKIEDR